MGVLGRPWQRAKVGGGGDAVDALQPWVYLHPDDLPASTMSVGDEWPNRGSRDWPHTIRTGSGIITTLDGRPALQSSLFGYYDAAEPVVPNATFAVVSDILAGVNQYVYGPYTQTYALQVDASGYWRMSSTTLPDLASSGPTRTVAAFRTGASASGLWVNGSRLLTANNMSLVGSQGWRRTNTRSVSSIMIFPPEVDPTEIAAAVDEVFA